MKPTGSYIICDEAERRIVDEDLVAPLHRVYVQGAFTDLNRAEESFMPTNVQARGQLLWACSDRGALMGMVILVPYSSPARCLARPGEAQMHLLAVDSISLLRPIYATYGFRTIALVSAGFVLAASMSSGVAIHSHWFGTNRRTL